MVRHRILIPTTDQSASVIAEHFGRAPYFAVFDVENRKIVDEKVYPNCSEHLGGHGHAHNNVFDIRPDIIIVKTMGARGLRSLKAANVAVLRTGMENVRKTVYAFLNGDLEELTTGCLNTHH